MKSLQFPVTVQNGGHNWYKIDLPAGWLQFIEFSHENMTYTSEQWHGVSTQERLQGVIPTPNLGGMIKFTKSAGATGGQYIHTSIHELKMRNMELKEATPLWIYIYSDPGGNEPCMITCYYSDEKLLEVV